MRITHLLVFFLSCCFAAMSWAAPVSFLSSRELLTNHQYGFSKASEIDLTRVAKLLPRGFSITGLLSEKGINWYRHSGDLVLDRPLDNGHALIVEGNLTIKGSYDDNRGSTGLLIVLGNMQAENVMSWGALAVAKHLQVSGVVCAYYNDFTFDAASVTARALLIDDKSGSVGKVEAPISFSSWNDAGKGSVLLALQTLVPEIVQPALQDEETLEGGFFLDFRQVQERIVAGEPLFRVQPGPSSLLADIELATAERISPVQFDRLVGKDRLLVAVLASREDLKPAWQNRLLATKDTFVLETLARNKGVSSAVLEQIAGVSGKLASMVMEHPNAPRNLIGKLVKEGSSEVRRVIAVREDLSATLLAQLAEDRDAHVRKPLIEANGHRLVPGSLAVLAADPDAEVRLAILQNSLLRLDAAQLSRLTKDAQSEVRAAAAARIARQTSWKQMPELPLAQLVSLAAGLVDDADESAAVVAMAALTPTEQERRWQAANPQLKRRLAAVMASSTRSELIQTQIAARRDTHELEELASNLALWPSVQGELFRQLQPAKQRSEMSALNAETISKAMNGPEGTISNLLENPNAAPAIIEQAAQYCADTLGRALFCNALSHRKDLSAKVIDILRASYRGDERKDLALTITLQPATTEAQLKWAVPVRMNNDEDILSEFKSLQKREGEAFWLALASTRNEKLRELAATNAHTPSATVQRLLKDKSEDVALAASANPALPAQVLESLPFNKLMWSFANPALSNARTEAILAWAVTRSESSLVSSCLETLAARALRQPARP